MASRFINSTGRHIFLTGRAGTGKTTFLREVVATTYKKVVVAAPTGIAAINAGGVTLHSLLHLPFGAYLPSDDGLAQMQITTQITTPRTLLRNIKLHETRRRLIREMELLIIDEVSMLRADMLDAIDAVLRHIRRKRNIPFGGLQLLFIGDLLQLPPVVKRDEWALLQAHYPGSFFFHAKALQHNPPIYLELDTIYRQSDPRFISLLNNMREERITHDDIRLLEKHVDPSYDVTKNEGYIFLTTHNSKADQINSRAIQQIKKRSYRFEAQLTGDFNESQYPLELSLELKEGAQVMFIKNDYSGERRYFNGKIGVVDEIGDEGIVVRFSDGSPPTGVERYTWENKKFSLNGETNEIEEKVAGTFAQYPLRLAWAITVHKSQGLTFDKAVIDVSAAFAPGQIYVALSRLTGLDGLVLSAPVPRRGWSADPGLQEFAQNKVDTRALLPVLHAESRRFIRDRLLHTFDLQPLTDTCRWHVDSYNKEESRSAKQGFRPWAATLRDDLAQLKDVAGRFLKQIHGIEGFSSWDGDDASAGYPGLSPQEAADRQTRLAYDSEGRNRDKASASEHDQELLALLHERVKAAFDYFKPLLKDFSGRIFAHINTVEGLTGVKGYVKELRELEAAFFSRLQMIQKMEALLRAFMDNAEPNRKSLSDQALMRERDLMLDAGGGRATGASKKGRRKKKGTKGSYEGTMQDAADRAGGSYDTGRTGGIHDAETAKPGRKVPSSEVTFMLYKTGRSVEEIATLRELAESTILSHLAQCVGKGMLEVELFLDKDKREQILQASKAVDSRKMTDIMAVLGDEFSYADVRFALASSENN